jgi:hypothetical protein
MKPYIKTLSNLLIILIIPVLFLSGCIEFQNNQSSFEVHEWGVFMHNYDSKVASFVTNPPSLPVYYDKPVIYFHCDEDLTNVNVEVDINGDILVTIPDANITENGIGWIVDIINNSVIAPNGTSYDYLFYEGQMNISQGVISYVLVNDENVTFYVKNIADYTISDVFFVYGKPYDAGMAYWFYRYHTAFCYIESLKTGEEKIMTSNFLDEPRSFVSTYHNNISSCFNNNVSLAENFIQLLINQGLTRDESIEFFEYWFDEWFKTGGYRVRVNEYSSLIYTIPQEIYDNLLPININPKPDAIKRVGVFYVRGIPIIKDFSDNDKEPLNVRTDKKVYFLGESVNVTFNVFSRPLGYLTYVGSECWRTWDRIGLEYYDGVSWVGVDFLKRSNASVPCPQWMPQGPVYHVSNESFSYLWDQKNSDLEQVSTGQYRFWLRSTSYSGKNGDTVYNPDSLIMLYFYSNEFTIV